ncbi:hypothetical protein TsFJ059_000903 [Trichoderma semiorbis]|uniref:Uncharacterized protein n=1 Tax=Trichoderma semiorbis TaxID=1491008 RepID=A0A9P8KZD3_9HYPO|nr:hypothetical protein TsFJ059_000903 [Trichoderma semiorbis]
MMSELHGQAQGLGGLFHVPNQPLVIHPDKKVALSSEPEGQFADDVPCGTAENPISLLEAQGPALLSVFVRRRFLVSIVEVGRGTGDWVAIIFDRYHQEETNKAPHLYVLDPHTMSNKADQIILDHGHHG